MILITSYKHPDLDGVACAVAYAELLQKQGKSADVWIYGNPHREAQYVLDLWRVRLPEKADSLLQKNLKIILVDNSQTHNISEKINLNDVIEIIDHRKINHADKFPHAKVQIEFVGAAATLIVERFQQAGVEPTQSSAALLFFAIISNTINFKNNVTTDRDKVAAAWLKNFFLFDEEDIKKVFVQKSIIAQPLKKVFMEDMGWHIFNHKKFTIFQLEIMDVKKFVKNNREEITKTLRSIKEELSFDFVLLSLVDLQKGFNLFVALDTPTEKLFKKALDVNFTDGIAYSDCIIMRKEIVPLVKEILGTDN